MSRKLTHEQFVERAHIEHGGIYTYPEPYVNSKTKINILCSQHGTFEQMPFSHLSGCGCPECGGRLPLNTTIFTQKANKVHGDGTYDYSMVVYINAHTKIKVICRSHGIFEQTPGNHLFGDGCPECGGTKKLTTERFIELAVKEYGLGTYDYSLVEYINATTNIKIGCHIHGVFEQTPHAHSSGVGCPECGRLRSEYKRRKGIDQFIIEANKVHGEGTYDYSLFEYVNSKTMGKIICHQHGIFEQDPGHHLRGHGCKKCSDGANISKSETIWLDSLGIPDDKEHRQVRLPGMGKRSVDGFDPGTNTAYEFHGDYFHGNLSKFAADEMNKTVKRTFGELYQETINKENLIKSLGYNLIIIWEGDWKKINKALKASP